jgi:hypothetical protein
VGSKDWVVNAESVRSRTIGCSVDGLRTHERQVEKVHVESGGGGESDSNAVRRTVARFGTRIASDLGDNAASMRCREPSERIGAVSTHAASTASSLGVICGNIDGSKGDSARAD